MKRRPFAYFIIIVNLGLLYSLFSSLQKITDSNGQAGAFMGYLFVAGFVNLILYFLFRVTAKRKK
jgi:FtsH-binding integral membrane protein